MQLPSELSQAPELMPGLSYYQTRLAQRNFSRSPAGMQFFMNQKAEQQSTAEKRAYDAKEWDRRNPMPTAPMPANAPNVVPEGFMPVPKAFLPSGQVQSWGLEPKPKIEAPTDATPRLVPLPGTGYGMAFAGDRPMGTLPMQQQTPQNDEDLMAEAYRVDTPEELRALMGKTRNMAIIKEARNRLDKMTTSSAPTDEVYWDSLNSKMVKIPAGYEPPPELGLKRMPRKGEGRLSRVMETTGGDSAAPPAPNRERNSRYFPGMK
jgi:hypothetical protein